MNVEELSEKLKSAPKGTPVVFKVDQELIGNSEYGWMMGEGGKCELTKLYLNERQGDCGMYVDPDQMSDEVLSNPKKYGLAEDPTDEQVESYLATVPFTEVLAITVKPGAL